MGTNSLQTVTGNKRWRTHTHTYTIDMTCRPVTRWAPNHLTSVMQSAVHTNCSFCPHPFSLSALWLFVLSLVIMTQPSLQHDNLSVPLWYVRICVYCPWGRSWRSWLLLFEQQMWGHLAQSVLHLHQSGLMKSAGTVPKCNKYVFYFMWCHWEYRILIKNSTPLQQLFLLYTPLYIYGERRHLNWHLYFLWMVNICLIHVWLEDSSLQFTFCLLRVPTRAGYHFKKLWYQYV